MFWLWQERHDSATTLDIMEGYPGTNSVDNQGPTPGVAPNSWLTLDSPLAPFRHSDGQPFTSRECVDIEQLGYTYGPGSLEQPETSVTADRSPQRAPRVISVRGVNRASIRGSFLISAFAMIDGKRQHVGSEAVLSRWHVQGCMNCQTHLEARAHFPVPDELEAFDANSVEIELHTRETHTRAPTSPAGDAPTQPSFSLRVH